MLARAETPVVFVHNESISYGSYQLTTDRNLPALQMVRSHKVPQKRFDRKLSLKRGKLRKRETQIW